MVEPEGINNRTIGVLVVVGALLTLVTIVFTDALFHRIQRDDAAEKALGMTGLYARDIAAPQLEKLSQYLWRDKEKQRVSIPIERAMELVVVEQARIQHAPVQEVVVKQKKSATK
jgi:hypothetical protein